MRENVPETGKDRPYSVAKDIRRNATLAAMWLHVYSVIGLQNP